ncbi:MAG TPA: hypothetical protein VFC93_21010 [Chloroflexota bacterium]|nr:hypothetical protein [Chloroflexota bacterium]
MVCPDVGALRAWIDEEGEGSASDVAAHLVSCRACHGRLEELRADAALAGRAVRSLCPPAEPSAASAALARQRIEAARRGGFDAAATSDDKRVVRLSNRFLRWRVAAAGLAAAIVLAVVGTDGGRTAAAAFLAQFRSQTIQPIAVDSSLGQSPLAQLDRLGAVQGERMPQPEVVASLADASAKVGFAVKAPDPATLPASVGKTPKIRVVAAHDLRFTFDEAKTRQYLRQLGRDNVTLPARFNGATLVVSFPAAVALQYGGPEDAKESRGQIGPMLIVGQSKEITAGVEGGASFDELRDFLLGLPGLPPETVRQLRAIQDWRNTLPLPVPVDRMNWEQTTIAGGPGLILTERTTNATAAIWQRNGQVFGVGGTVPRADLQRVADSIR